MPLNKSKGNMYSFINATWNPLAGKCEHNCSYCSTNKFYYPVLKKKYSGEIRLQESELKTNLGKDNYIFVVAQHDLFSKSVPHECIISILEHCNKYNNSYLFQSKNPERIQIYMDFLPKKSVICTTIESNRCYPKIMHDSPSPLDRAIAMARISLDFKTYVTIEPLLEFDLKELVQNIRICFPSQVNLGADSGNNNLPEPPKEKVLELITELEKFTVVKQKTNLNRLLK